MVGPVRVRVLVSHMACDSQADEVGRTLKGMKAQESIGSRLVATPVQDNGFVERAKP